MSEIAVIGILVSAVVLVLFAMYLSYVAGSKFVKWIQNKTVKELYGKENKNGQSGRKTSSGKF